MNEENEIETSGSDLIPADNSVNEWDNLSNESDDTIEGEFSVEAPAKAAVVVKENAKPNDVSKEEKAGVKTENAKTNIAKTNIATSTAQPAAKTATSTENISAPEAIEQTKSEPVKPAAEVVPFDWTAWESDSVKGLVDTYKLSKEDAEALVTEPENVLPKLAATVHVAVIKNVLAHLPQILPALMEQIQTTKTNESASKDKFFSVNDDLKDDKFLPMIQAVGKTFRELNPQADAETAAFQVGNMVRSALGMNAKTANVAAPVAAPAARTVPFNSAQAGATGVKVATDNPFAQLANEFLEDMT